MIGKAVTRWYPPRQDIMEKKRRAACHRPFLCSGKEVIVTKSQIKEAHARCATYTQVNINTVGLSFVFAIPIDG